MRKIALVRGRYLNRYEMQSYEPLAKKYDITAFGSLTSYHTKFAFPTARFLSPLDLLSVTNVLLPNRITLAVMNRMFVDANMLIDLEKRLQGYDIAHTAETYFGFTHQCILAKRHQKVKKVVCTVYENIPHNNEGISGRVGYKHAAISEVDHFIAVSQKAKDALIEEGCPESKITIIPAGIDTALFHPTKKSSDSAIQLLFCGRLEKEKGIYEVFDAMKILIKSARLVEIPLQLLLVGNGSEKEVLIEKTKAEGLERYIHFQNHEYEDMPNVYRNADIFIAPSKPTAYWQEQFGMVFLEAMASGLPIVTTDSGSIRETVGEDGAYVDVGSSEQIVERVIELVRNTKKRMVVSKKMRERAVSHFDHQKIANKIDKIYTTLLKG